jgi:glyoxylase-like metal-dependent hydrolase (beta-lactamase superfamily II)
MESWEEVADRVYVLHYRLYRQGIGVIAGGGELMVVDTRTSHRQATEIRDDLAAIPGLRTLPVRHVVNTHRHIDHTLGNRVFRPVSIWGHAECAAGLRRWGERDRQQAIQDEPELAEELAESMIDPPDLTFSDESRSIDLAGRQIELRHLGRGHTDGDAVVLVPDVGVLFAGDLVVQGEAPWFGDSYPLDWPATEERLAALAGDVVVPGHGAVVNREFVQGLAADLRTLADLAQRGQADGSSVSDLLPSAPWGDDARIGLERALAHLAGREATADV